MKTLFLFMLLLTLSGCTVYIRNANNMLIDKARFAALSSCLEGSRLTDEDKPTPNCQSIADEHVDEFLGEHMTDGTTYDVKVE